MLYAVLGGFRTNAQLAESPAGLPDPWVLENYQRVLTSASFWRYALNSTVIAVVTTVVAVVFGLMAAYPLARYRFRWREPLYMVFVLGLLFPATVAIIPLFIIITRQLHLGNTWWGVALPQAAFALPVTIVILRPFLMAIPNELEEAAVIDGASRIQVFWRIIVPLSGPGVVTVGVLAFVASWNAYLLPLLLLQGDMKTLPLGRRRLLLAVLLRHGRRLRLHHAGDDPGAGLLPRHAAADRQRPPGRGEGLTHPRATRPPPPSSTDPSRTRP